MKTFLTALKFLTVIPVKTKVQDETRLLAKSMAYFPLVGVILGLLLAAVNILTSHIFPEYVVNLLLIISLIILTGGLHLDGLADTVDAMSSGKGIEEMLRIMKESTLGTMGAVALICVLATKFSLLTSIPHGVKLQALVLMPALSRWSIAIPAFLFKYPRKSGTGRLFIEEMNIKIFIVATALAITISWLVFQETGLIAMLTVGLFAILIGYFFGRRIGGTTGDTLGAVNELSECFCLAAIFILVKLCKA